MKNQIDYYYIDEEIVYRLNTTHFIFPGDHKKRAKYRFASKTLMRILPDNLKTEVEALINAKTMTLDLYEILGQCTWGQGTKGV